MTLIFLQVKISVLTEVFNVNSQDRRINGNSVLQVIELAVQRLPGNRDYIVSLFDTLISSDIDHFWLLAIDSSGKIQGFCNLRPKKFMIHGHEFDVLGSSYMVTSKLKILVPLLPTLYVKTYLVKVVIMILSWDSHGKKMDYYWSRFGFMGLGCYPCLELSLYDIDIQKIAQI